MENITEPITELVIEPITELVIEPITELVIEPLSESIVEQVVEPEPSMEYKVVQNSDVLYKSDIQWANDIDYVKPNAFEIEMLHGTKKPKELLEEEKDEVIVLKTEEEIKKQKTKDLLLIFKVVSLNRLGRHPILNTSTLQPHELKEFLKMMNLLVDEYNNGLEIEITTEFNKICIEKLFINNTDVSTFPVYA
jgi:hypothetical protein